MSLHTGLPLFVGTIVVLVLIVSGSMLFRFRPTRVCPMCGELIAIEANRCRICGYAIDRFRGLDL